MVSRTVPTRVSSTSPLLNRLPELDGLRGFAIVSVMAFHYFDPGTIQTDGVVARLRPVAAMGWIGADLFLFCLVS
jgi:peptidoglycan/LPS O-acetylase OafA/YrhL